MNVISFIPFNCRLLQLVCWYFSSQLCYATAFAAVVCFIIFNIWVQHKRMIWFHVQVVCILIHMSFLFHQSRFFSFLPLNYFFFLFSPLFFTFFAPWLLSLHAFSFRLYFFACIYYIGNGFQIFSHTMIC